MATYSVEKSKNTEETIVAFLQAPWSSALEDVPGIGPKTKERLAAKNVTTLFQLAGVCMTLRAHNLSQAAWEQQLWEYFATVGIAGPNLHSLIHAMSEKLEISFPGMAGGAADAAPENVLRLAVHGEGFGFGVGYSAAAGLEWPAFLQGLPEKAAETLTRCCADMAGDPARVDELIPVVTGVLRGCGIAVTEVTASVTASMSPEEDADGLSADN